MGHCGRLFHLGANDIPPILHGAGGCWNERPVKLITVIQLFTYFSENNGANMHTSGPDDSQVATCLSQNLIFPGGS